jgi:microcystin-dependent protein
MGDYFVGELRVFTYNRVPAGWLPCDGRTLNIQGNAALYSLLGTVFGGNGTTTFGIPDLRGRVALGIGALSGQTYIQGNIGGTEGVALTAGQIAAHTHAIGAVSAATSRVPLTPQGTFVSGYIGDDHQNTAPSLFAVYAPVPGPQPMTNWTSLDGSTIGPAGGGAAHENRQPILPLQICIATTGLYPQRN